MRGLDANPQKVRNTHSCCGLQLVRQILIRTVCCIYHPNRPVGESDESDSSSSSDSDSESDNDKRMETGSGKWNNRKCKHGDHHDAHHQHEHDEHAEINAQGGERGKTRRPSPNAYEKMPKTRLKKGGGSTMTEVVKQ